MQVKLFTHTDLDGIGCAIVAFLAFGKENVNVEYCNYDEINDAVTKYLSAERIEHDKVFITDISVDEKTAELINEKHKVKPGVFYLLDHHETAEWLNEYEWANVQLIHSMDQSNTSGTSLFYRWLLSNINSLDLGELNARKLFNYDTAKFVETIRRYDTWDWYNIYLDAYPKRVNDLFYLYGRDRFIEKTLQSFMKNRSFTLTDEDVFVLTIEKQRIDRHIDLAIKHAKIINIGEYKAAVTFGNAYNSEICHALLDAYDDVDLAAMVNLTKGTISFRTDRKNVDVGKVAKHFGGGGRAQTSGCQISDEKIEEILNIIFN